MAVDVMSKTLFATRADLVQNNLNVRANIMYFLESLCEISQRDGHFEFIKMIRRDIYTIVDAVAPPDQAGAANVKVVRKILASMGEKQFLAAESVSELEASLKDREGAMDEQEDVTMGDPEDGKSLAKGGEGLNGPLKLGGPGRPDKRQVEQRIEEDRERHKRLKESIWEVSAKDDDEFDKMWDEASNLGDDDYIRADEESEERKRCLELEVEARDSKA